jgi:hypothetical protein
MNASVRRLGVACLHSANFPEEGDAMPYFQTCDKTYLFYVDAGAGTPMVFVASAWLDSRMWEFQIPHLVEHGFR